MRLGIVGRGPWGNVYSVTLSKMGVQHWQMGRSITLGGFDGIIVASAAASHYPIAMSCICAGIPVLIEKPITLTAEDADSLLATARNHRSIVFTGHTRLYSQAWRAFKAQVLADGVESVYAVAGGECKLGPLWDWGPHLVAMCLDLGVAPERMHIVTVPDETPVKIIVNGKFTYTDQPETPSPLETLLTEFMAAIEAGKPDIAGLELGVKVVEILSNLDKELAVA